jgi:hypothetical protein
MRNWLPGHVYILTLESRVGLESLLKLFMRYQMDLRILEEYVSRSRLESGEKNTYEAKGVTPIPAPTKTTVS